MSIFLLSGCCNPCQSQCTRRYNFDDSSDSMDVAQFRAYDDPGGTTPVTVYWDSVAEELDIEGEGCYAVEIIPASVTLKTIHVAAMVSVLTSGSVGVTIRRPESDGSISLWWLGGTSYELRHGTTVIETITHTAATDEIKLELTTPKDPTTDVLVYIGGALVHTEAAVAFVMPDVLNLGVAIDGEATVDWVEVSPCPVECEVVSYCYDNIWDDTVLRMPRTWYASIPWPSDHGFVDCSSLLVDFLYPREAWFIPATDAVFYNHDIEAWDDWGGCGFVPVTPHRVTIGDPQYTVDPYDLPPLPSGKWPVEYGGTCVGDTLIPYYNSAYVSGRSVHSWRFNVEFQNVGTLGSPIVEYRIRVHISDRDPMSNVIVEHVVYASSWVPIIGNETLDSDVTLTLIANNSPYTGWDSTITLTPDGPSEAIVRYLAKCGDLCEPPVTPQPGVEYILDLIFDDGSDTYERRVCMGVSYNETTGSWEWAGITDPWGHSTCGTVPASDYKIHCVEPEEGALKQWALEIENTNGVERIPLSEDPILGLVFDGTVDNMCPPSTWSVLGYNWTTATEGHQFGWCDMPLCDGNWFSAAITVNCSSGTVNGSALLLPTSGFPPGINPLTVMGTAYVGSVFGRTIWLWSDGAGYVFRFYDGITDTGINPIGGSFSCDIGGGATLDPGSASWSWTNSADPLGVCSGITGSASMSVTWT